MNPEPARIFALFRPSRKIDASCGRLPVPGVVGMEVEGLIWCHFAWHLDVLLPSVAVEWIAIERFMLALVVVAVVVPRSGFLPKLRKTLQ